MWKKKDSEASTPEPGSPLPSPAPPRPQVRRTERAVLGPTLRIDGEISGGEDLLVQGQVEGKIVVEGQGVTVGKSGRVKADIHARSIRVEGHVRGDLYGDQEVIIEASGDVQGNLVAPSVRLENGSRFKGSIDMEQTQRAKPPASSTPAVKQGAALSPSAKVGPDAPTGATSTGPEAKTSSP